MNERGLTANRARSAGASFGAASPGEEPEAEHVALVVAEIDRRRFGFPLDQVLEVQRMVALTPLPDAPPIVEGVIDLRGRVVPVLDIRDRFGLEPRDPVPADQLVLAQADARVVAVRVESTVGIVGVAPDEIETDKGGVPGVSRIAGVTRDADGLVLIHDLATFLSWDEADRLDAALSEATRS